MNARKLIIFLSSLLLFAVLNSALSIFLIITFGLSSRFMMNLGIVISLLVTSSLFACIGKFHNLMKIASLFCLTFLFTQYILLTTTPLHSLLPEKVLLRLELIQEVSRIPNCDTDESFANAKTFFKNSLDFSDVKIYLIGKSQLTYALTKFLHHNSHAAAWGNYIYILNDGVCLSTYTLAHELTHVWQFQSGEGFGLHWVPKWAKYFWLYFTNKDSLYDYGGPDGLLQAKNEGIKFSDFNLEQQAMIVENFFVLKSYPLATQAEPDLYNHYQLLTFFVPSEFK